MAVGFRLLEGFTAVWFLYFLILIFSYFEFLEIEIVIGERERESKEERDSRVVAG